MRERSLCFLLAALVAGCTPTVAQLTYAPSNCAKTVDASRALILVKDGSKLDYENFNSSGQCLLGDDGKPTPFVLYRLPTSGDRYVVYVRSQQVGSAVLPPKIHLMTENLSVQTVIGADQLNFYSGSIGTTFWVNPDSRYLLITVDTASVGIPADRVETRVNASAVAIPAGGVIPIYTGHDEMRHVTRSYNGKVSVWATTPDGQKTSN